MKQSSWQELVGLDAVTTRPAFLLGDAKLHIRLCIRLTASTPWGIGARQPGHWKRCAVAGYGRKGAAEHQPDWPMSETTAAEARVIASLSDAAATGLDVFPGLQCEAGVRWFPEYHCWQREQSRPYQCSPADAALVMTSVGCRSPRPSLLTIAATCRK
ncbi:hypothetical protein LZ31DRAFT_205122 [Colletotrichum somersetense]|nr:hypothetical protein LZ31DRAFT_205122 [Colletotrichum somersetense]